MTHEQLLNDFVRLFNKAVGFDDCDVYDYIRDLEYLAPPHHTMETTRGEVSLNAHVTQHPMGASPDFFDNFSKAQNDILKLALVASNAEILHSVNITDSSDLSSAMVKLDLDSISVCVYPDGRYVVKDYKNTFVIDSKQFKLTKKQFKRIVKFILQYCLTECEDDIEYTVRQLQHLNEQYKTHQARLHRILSQLSSDS